jgi:hypothetical protein
VEHSLRIAGCRGSQIFNSNVYDSIATATEGIPRNVNNFCFNALSLACALRKRTVDAEVVKEVIADLDLQKLTWGAPSEVTAGSAPYTFTTVMASAEAEPETPDALRDRLEPSTTVGYAAAFFRETRSSSSRGLED